MSAQKIPYVPSTSRISSASTSQPRFNPGLTQTKDNSQTRMIPIRINRPKIKQTLSNGTFNQLGNNQIDHNQMGTNQGDINPPVLWFQTQETRLIPNRFENYELISYESEPTSWYWALPCLYKKAKNGKYLLWQIGFRPQSNDLVMIRGYLGGKIQITDYGIDLNLSGRNFNEQALIEAKNRYLKKTREGYTMDGSINPDTFKLMKAPVYKPQKTVLHLPVLIEPKLNGIRVAMRKGDDGQIIARSYNNTRYTSLEHLEIQVVQLLEFLPAGTIVDGEVYIHGVSLQKISGTVRAQKSTNLLTSQLDYYLFDLILPNDQPLDQRKTYLTQAYNQWLESWTQNYPDYTGGLLRCHHYYLASNLEEIATYHQSFVQQGYEGTMIKCLANGAQPDSSQYKRALYREGKTHTNIFKYKDFHDEEGTIIGVREGKGTNKGCAIFVIQDCRGNVLKGITMESTHEQRKYWLENSSEVIGKQLTFRYFELTEDGVPYIPIGVAIRDYE